MGAYNLIYFNFGSLKCQNPFVEYQKKNIITTKTKIWFNYRAKIIFKPKKRGGSLYSGSSLIKELIPIIRNLQDNISFV